MISRGKAYASWIARTARVDDIRGYIFWSDFWWYGDLWDDMLDLE